MSRIIKEKNGAGRLFEKSVTVGRMLIEFVISTFIPLYEMPLVNWLRDYLTRMVRSIE